MTNEVKPVAKSLHTLTVLVQVAKLIERNYSAAATNSVTVSRSITMGKAMEALGLSGRPDPYELQEKALRLWKD
jgi:hypothetical protein